jgi:hypothetical protein
MSARSFMWSNTMVDLYRFQSLLCGRLWGSTTTSAYSKRSSSMGERALQATHGKLRPQTPRARELSVSPAAPSDPVTRDAKGRILGSAAAKVLGHRGGSAKHKRIQTIKGARVRDTLGTEQAAHWQDATAFADAQAKELGGEPSPAVMSLLVTGGLQFVASGILFGQALSTGEPDAFAAASRLGDASRANILSAHELHARESARRADTGVNTANIAAKALLAIEGSSQR